MAPLAPVGADDHPHRERRPVLERTQRTQIVGDPLGQHWHDAVGEIHRIAALQGFLVERGGRQHVIGDIGDRDGQHIAAGIGGIRVRRGMDGVVVVLGVGGIDRHQRQVAPVFAMSVARRTRRLSLFEGSRGEHMRDVVRDQRDQADGALGVHGSEPLDHARRRQPESALAQHFQRDELALFGIPVQTIGNEHFPRGALLLDRHHAPGAVLQLAVDAEGTRAGSIEDLDDPPAMRLALGVGIDPQQHPRADGWGRRLVALQAGVANPDARRLARLGPIDGSRDQLAVAVALADVGDQHRRQGALALENLATARDGAVRLEFPDQQFEFRLGGALDAERARHVALGDPSGRLDAVRRRGSREKGEHLVARGERVRPSLGEHYSPRPRGGPRVRNLLRQNGGATRILGNRRGDVPQTLLRRARQSLQAEVVGARRTTLPVE